LTGKTIIFNFSFNLENKVKKMGFTLIVLAVLALFLTRVCCTLVDNEGIRQTLKNTNSIMRTLEVMMERFEKYDRCQAFPEPNKEVAASGPDGLVYKSIQTCFSIHLSEITYSGKASVTYNVSELVSSNGKLEEGLMNVTYNVGELVSYNGELEEGLMHGTGKALFKNGAVLNGTFVKGSFEGGKVFEEIFDKKKTLVASFSAEFDPNGFPNGDGNAVITDGNGKVIYNGAAKRSINWRNAITGYGRVFYPNGESYQGFLKDTFREGSGIFTNYKGEEFPGTWSGNCCVEGPCKTGTSTSFYYPHNILYNIL